MNSVGFSIAALSFLAISGLPDESYPVAHPIGPCAGERAVPECCGERL